MDDSSQRAVGVEMNGHVWDGAKWVSIPPQPTPSGHQQSPRSAGSGSPPPLHLWQQRLPQPSGFTDPHYGYGLTRQTSDDLQFIARFIKIMIIIWIVVTILGMILVPLTLGSLFAALGNLLSQVPR